MVEISGDPGPVARSGTAGICDSGTHRSEFTTARVGEGIGVAKVSATKEGSAGARRGAGELRPMIEDVNPPPGSGVQFADTDGGRLSGVGVDLGSAATRSSGMVVSTGSAATASPSASTVNHATCPPLVSSTPRASTGLPSCRAMSAK